MTISDKLHKFNGTILGSFALVLLNEIGYNVVTKVTTSAFGCHNSDKSVSKECRQ